MPDPHLAQDARIDGAEDVGSDPDPRRPIGGIIIAR